MTEFTAPSGAKILITPADWKSAKVLKKAIEKELNLDEGLDFTNPATWIKNIISVDSSDAVDSALWPCLARCTRDNEKITEQTFDKLEARQDYYEIVSACIKENLGPLVESLFSKLSALGATVTTTQAQEPLA